MEKIEESSNYTTIIVRLFLEFTFYFIVG